MHNLAGYIIIIYATALDVYDGCKRYEYDGKIISYHNAMFRLSFMMTSSNGLCSVWLALCTGNSPVPLTKASNAELWRFLWSAPKQTVE